MSVELIREYWAYHHWANRRLFGVVTALGEEAAGREIRQAVQRARAPRDARPHVRRRLVLARDVAGRPPAIVRGDPTYGLDIRTLGALRGRWDELEAEQRRFLADLVETDLWRPLDGKTPEGRTFSRPLGMLLLHVPTTRPTTGASSPRCSRW